MAQGYGIEEIFFWPVFLEDGFFIFFNVYNLFIIKEVVSEVVNYSQFVHNFGIVNC